MQPFVNSKNRVWYCICAHENYISIVENRNRILISNTLLICDIFRFSDLPPTIPRSTARVRQMVAVRFLIQEVWKRTWWLGSPITPGWNRVRPLILVSNREVLFIILKRGWFFRVGVSFSYQPVGTFERRIPFSGSNLAPIWPHNSVYRQKSHVMIQGQSVTDPQAAGSLN